MMEKLPMCRICLAENVNMYVVVNETLHDLYEKLTDIPFVTEDSRPILACFICCAQLKKCYRFQKKCLEAEERFAKMMNKEYERKPLINQDQFELFHGFIRTPIDTISIVDVDQTENIVVKEELPAVCERLDDIKETKEEYDSDDDIKTVNIYDNYLDIEDAPSHHSASDSNDDIPLLEVKKEGEAEKTSEPPAVKKQETDTRRTKLADFITTKQKKEDTKMIQDNQNRTSESNIAKHQKVQNRINDSRRKLGLSQHGDTGEKPYKCDFCPNTFRDDSLLARHRLIHIGEKPFKCDICQRCFRLKAGLNQHKRLHTGEKPFKCDICPDTFRYGTGLTLHKQKHVSHKPYQCDVCQKRFHRPCYLRSHYQIHTGEKPFQCDMCQSSFSRKTTLERHILRHTGEKPFQCHICQSCFSRKSILTVHMNRHTGEKPFKCHICQSSFTQKSTLRTHILRHTGEKPFQCHICQSCFSRRSILTKHMNRHTGEKDLEKQDGI